MVCAGSVARICIRCGCSAVSSCSCLYSLDFLFIGVIMSFLIGSGLSSWLRISSLASLWVFRLVLGS